MKYLMMTVALLLVTGCNSTGSTGSSPATVTPTPAIPNTGGGGGPLPPLPENPANFDFSFDIPLSSHVTFARFNNSTDQQQIPAAVGSLGVTLSIDRTSTPEDYFYKEAGPKVEVTGVLAGGFPSGMATYTGEFLEASYDGDSWEFSREIGDPGTFSLEVNFGDGTGTITSPDNWVLDNAKIMINTGNGEFKETDATKHRIKGRFVRWYPRDNVGGVYWAPLPDNRPIVGTVGAFVGKEQPSQPE